MAGFSGFTEDEIRHFKAQGEVVPPDRTENRNAVKKASLNKSGKRSKPREKIRTKPLKNNAATVTVRNEVSTSPSPPAPKKGETAGKPAENAKDVKDSKHDKKDEKEREIEVIIEPERIKEIELSNLEKMRQEQKEMEKINKKNEKMLQQTLKERYKKTKKETETLKLVQKELSHLDHLLSGDVDMLRDKIDEACREYDYAKKRYERAEAEFISAKISLHEKSETKDQLTEHLCSIIQENEKRKAKKLAELMSKLELAEQDVSLCEDDEADGEQHIIANRKENIDVTIEDEAPKSPAQVLEKTPTTQDKLEEKPIPVQGISSPPNESVAPVGKKNETLIENESHSLQKDNNNVTSSDPSDVQKNYGDLTKTVQTEPINR